MAGTAGAGGSGRGLTSARHQVALWQRLNRREIQLEDAEVELSRTWLLADEDRSEELAHVRRLLSRATALREAVNGREAVTLPICRPCWGPICLGMGQERGLP